MSKRAPPVRAPFTYNGRSFPALAGKSFLRSRRFAGKPASTVASSMDGSIKGGRSSGRSIFQSSKPLTGLARSTL